MAIKSSIILAMFLGVVTYAHSKSLSEAHGFSLDACKKILSRAGYVEVEQRLQPKGRLVETFELRTPSGPHCNLIWQIEVTSRDDQVLDIGTYGSNPAMVRD